MNTKTKELFDKISEINESVAIIDVKDIKFHPSLRQLCEMNTCGAYGKNYTCPPHVGDIDELIKQAQSYETAIIYRHVYELEDSFDIEGMNEGSANFDKLTFQILKLTRAVFPDALVISAGGCRLCEKCGAVDNIPCRHPDLALSSLEGYGIQVSELAGQVGMKYISGQNTVTYFGGVFIK